MKVYICMIVLAFGIQGGWTYVYPNLDTLKNDAIYLCCHNYIGTSSPILLKEDAVSYGLRFNDVFGLSSGIYNECCEESCSLEEVNEGYAFKSEEFGEECIDEGCDYEEMTEHCPHWV